MSKQVRLRRGTTAQHSSFTGAQGEVTVDTDKKVVVVHDGSTAGGVPMFPSTGGTITGMTAFGAGLKLTGPATLGAAAAKEWSYEHPVTRYYFGDGSGYSVALSKRVGGATTDMLTLTDTGNLSVTGGGTFGGNVTASHASAEDNNAGFTNTHANGYGLYSRGGSGGRYAAQFNDKDGNQLMLLSGSGALTVAGGGTFAGTVTAQLPNGSNGTFRGFKFGVTGDSTDYGGTTMEMTTGEVRHSAGFSGWGGSHTYYTNGSYRGQWSDAGLWLVGATSSSGYGDCHRISRGGGQGVNILAFDGGVEVSGLFQAVSGAGANTTDSALRLGKNSITNRSISAGGTINASGADYAEYEWNNGLLFYKGEIVGFKSDGTLTNKFSESIRFAVKSTNPSIVGGDNWGNSEAVGEKPVKPVFVSPEYTGISQPTEIQNTITEESTEEEISAYNAAFAEYNQLIEQFNSDQETHRELVQEARRIFDEETFPAYEVDLAEFEERLELARRMVDRIAYAGKVPCNVQGTQAGDYIIPTAGPNDSIVGISTNDPTFSQYRKAVGRVNKILEDGRAEIAVMIH